MSLPTCLVILSFVCLLSGQFLSTVEALQYLPLPAGGNLETFVIENKIPLIGNGTIDLDAPPRQENLVVRVDVVKDNNYSTPLNTTFSVSISSTTDKTATDPDADITDDDDLDVSTTTKKPNSSSKPMMSLGLLVALATLCSYMVNKRIIL